jgi:hypothetical protein
METELYGADSPGGVRRKIAALGLALAIVGLCTGKSMAGDLSAMPAQGLNVTGATTSALPAIAPTASVLPDASGGGAPEDSWLSGLHVSGFLSQTFGMW